MSRPLIVGLAIAAAIAGLLYSRWSSPPAPAQAPVAALPDPSLQLPGATLLEGLGSYRFPVTAAHPEVQRWFDQGLALTYGFNHDAAERSFLKATQLDPDCAMCWWGAALVLGPHVNASMDPANNGKAWERLQKAVALAPKATPREQGYIKALQARYAAAAPSDRKPLDEAYAQAAGALAAQFPDDLDAATFQAEALMDLQPWDYYDAQLQPKGHTAQVVALLESVLARNPDHAGALHLYVHAVEASGDPQRGVDAADRLRTLVPGSGHLVHMPAHIYARVGRWHDAVIANQRAIDADDAYLAACRGNYSGVYPLGYVPHNHHFLWFAASMEGAGAIAKAAAEETARRTDLPELMRQPGFAALQSYWMTPWFNRVRFGRWDEIAALPNPAPDLPYVSAIWRYAQGMAAVRQERLEHAEAHLAELSRLAVDPVFDTMLVWDRYPLTHAVKIAERTLAAELALARQDAAAALAALREATAIEDRIPYDEPPGWHAPTRHALGAALLASGQPAEAEWCTARNWSAIRATAGRCWGSRRVWMRRRRTRPRCAKRWAWLGRTQTCSLPPRTTRRVALAGAFAFAALAGTTRAAIIAVGVDVSQDRRAIDPQIYGVNFGTAAQLSDPGYTVRRWGGNSTTRYNYQVDVHSTASDYYYLNFPTLETNPPNDSTANRFLSDTLASAAEPILTIGTIGWTPLGVREKRYGFAIAKYGPQLQNGAPFDSAGGNGECDVTQNATGYCVDTPGNGPHLIVGNDPADTSFATGPDWTRQWISHLRQRHGTGANGGVRYYALDNEVMLWNSTHRDVHPQPATYDEIWQKTVAHASCDQGGRAGGAGVRAGHLGLLRPVQFGRGRLP
jgi:tetratricopeptide (TPR) repeat protein